MTSGDAPPPAAPGPANDAAPGTPSSDPVSTLLDVLDLVREGPDLFTGGSLPQLNGRIYGGQVLAQAILAAGRTLEADRLPHSMHGYFLRPGALDVPITFEVERMRDGRSFSARRTRALQHGEPILSMTASFQEDQPGIEFAHEAPEVPPPDEVPSAHEQLSAVDHPAARFWVSHAAFDLRHVAGSLFLSPAERAEGRQLVWLRARRPVEGDQLLHRALLAYACDMIMLEPVLRRGGLSWQTSGLSMASLDHAMWWHRDVAVDEWLLFVQYSPSAQGGRGLGGARVYQADGTLVASMAQEGMIRVPEI